MNTECTLIQTGICNIVYGNFRGEPNQELFRCPRGQEDLLVLKMIQKYRI